MYSTIVLSLDMMGMMEMLRGCLDFNKGLFLKFYVDTNFSCTYVHTYSSVVL